MTYDLVVADGLLVTSDGTSAGSVGITGGRIAAIAQTPLAGHEVIDARDRVVLPGAVDLHVHFNEPGSVGTIQALIGPPSGDSDASDRFCLSDASPVRGPLTTVWRG